MRHCQVVGVKNLAESAALIDKDDSPRAKCDSQSVAQQATAKDTFGGYIRRFLRSNKVAC